MSDGPPNDGPEAVAVPLCEMANVGDAVGDVLIIRVAGAVVLEMAKGPRSAPSEYYGASSSTPFDCRGGAEKCQP
jgi:hypothetical protein